MTQILLTIFMHFGQIIPDEGQKATELIAAMNSRCLVRFHRAMCGMACRIN